MAKRITPKPRLPAAVNRLEGGHDSEPGDCGLISLGCYLGIPYTDIIRSATLVTPDGGKFGLGVREIKRIAKFWNATLKTHKTFDPEEAYGIVLWLGRPGHCAVLRNGLVFDRLTVWEWADWLREQKCKPEDCRLYTLG